MQSKTDTTQSILSIECRGPHNLWPEEVVLPEQIHGAHIVEIQTGQEDLSGCDGLWTSIQNDLPLGIQTADCAPIAFWDDQKYGLIHAGWRGCINGIVEKMLKLFDPQIVHIHVGPILPQFEIQKDACYDEIYAKFGDQFFQTQAGKIIFDFQACLTYLLPTATLDGRSTFENQDLASWRRDQNEKRNLTIIKKSIRPH